MTQGRLLCLLSVLLASSYGLGQGKPGHAQNGRPFLQYPFASMPTQTKFPLNTAKVNQRVSLKIDLKVSPVSRLDQTAVSSPEGASGPSPSKVSYSDLQLSEFDLGTGNAIPAEFRNVINTDHMRLPRLQVPFDEVSLSKVNLPKVNLPKLNLAKVNFPKVRPPTVNLFKASPIEFKPPTVNLLKAEMSKVKLAKVKGSLGVSDLETWWDEGSEHSEP